MNARLKGEKQYLWEWPLAYTCVCSTPAADCSPTYIYFSNAQSFSAHLSPVCSVRKFPQWEKNLERMSLEKLSFFCKRDHSCLSKYGNSQPNEGNSRERQRYNPTATPGKCIFTNSLALHSCSQALANYPREGESVMQEYFKKMGGGAGEYVCINSIACSFDRFGTGREHLHRYKREVMYAALLLHKKELLEM